MSLPPSFVVKPGDVVAEHGVFVPRRGLCRALVNEAVLLDVQIRIAHRLPLLAILIGALISEARQSLPVTRSRHQHDEVLISVAPWAQRLSSREAARALGVSKSTAERAMRSGQLPAVKDHGRWLVDPQDLENYRATGAA